MDVGYSNCKKATNFKLAIATAAEAICCKILVQFWWKRAALKAELYNLILKKITFYESSGV